MPPVQTSPSSSGAGSSYCSAMTVFFILDYFPESLYFLAYYLGYNLSYLNCSKTCLFKKIRWHTVVLSSVKGTSRILVSKSGGHDDGPGKSMFYHFLRSFPFCAVYPYWMSTVVSILLGFLFSYWILWLEPAWGRKKLGGKRNGHQWTGPWSWRGWWG